MDDDTFSLVQSRLADPRRKTQQGTDRKHLGAGLFECATCHSKVRSWSGNRYRCPNGCLTRSQGNIDDFVIKVIRGRLARPDVADLLAPKDSAEAKEIDKEVRRLRTRLARIEEDYDAGDIDGHRYKVANEKVQAQLAEAQRRQARLSPARAVTATLLAADPVAAFDAAPLMIRRNVVDALCVVSLSPTPCGRKAFDPDSVKVTWRGATG